MKRRTSLADRRHDAKIARAAQRNVLRYLTADRDEWRTQAVKAASDHHVLLVALKDAVAFMDRLSGGKHGQEWTVQDVKRIEEIRLLSLGI